MKLFLLMGLVFSQLAMAKVTELSFLEEGKTFKAQLYFPKKEKSPGTLVVIVHEWWGKNWYPEMRAKMLQKEGYANLVVDLYGDNAIVETPDEAGKLAGPFYKDSTLAVNRLNKFLDLIKEDKRIDQSKVFAIGYCFGGTQVLNWARSGANLKGVVSFHGGLGSTIKAKDVKAKALVLNGAADPMVPAAEIAAFKSEMKDVDVNLEFIDYPGALHAFTNPKATEVGKKFKLPVAYDKKADQDSWKRLIAFLKS
jgi:dienelactone hydrolase